MHEDQIAEYRVAAAACIKWAEQETNKATSLRWRKVAEKWTRMADNLERKLRPPTSGSLNHGGN